MKTVAAYVRVSTNGQVGEDKFGLPVQEEQIRKYAEEHDMKIVRWYRDEGESGAKFRPGFNALISDETTNPPIEAVLVAKSDRVARDINIYYYYKLQLQMKNIELISIAEDFAQFGVFAPILQNFIVVFAQLERDMIQNRTSSGRIAKAKSGGYSGGRAPYGYDIHNSSLVVNEEEAQIVQKCFRLWESGWTKKGIAEVLNNGGHHTRSGGAFYASNVASILSNRRTYEGYYRYGKYGEDAAWVRGQHEPILSEGVYVREIPDKKPHRKGVSRVEPDEED